MKKLTLLVGFAALVLCGSAFGHNGLEFDLPQSPNNVIVLDGDEGDWVGLDDSFKFDRSRLEVEGGEPFPPADDLDVTWWFAYTLPPENMLYFFARIQDDILILDEVDASRHWTDDSLQFALDMDHGGGGIVGNDLDEVANGARYHMRTHPIPGEPSAWNDQQQRVDLPDLAWISDCAPTGGNCQQSDTFLIAWKVEPAGAGHMSTDVTLTWEFKLKTWDIQRLTEAESIQHVFKEFEIVHLEMRIFDADTIENLTWRIHPIGGTGPNAVVDGEVMTDWFALDAADTGFTPTTAVQGSSWGKIKSHLDSLQ